MNRLLMRAVRVVVVMLAGLSCGGSVTDPGPLSGTFVLTEENGQSLPADPFAPYGCCLTRSGRLTLAATTYDLMTTHTNKNNGITFDNAEQGTYTRRGDVLTFTRVTGGGAGYPYLLAPGTVSADGSSITLRYGDEGPGSNQVSALYRRQ